MIRNILLAVVFYQPNDCLVRFIEEKTVVIEKTVSGKTSFIPLDKIFCLVSVIPESSVFCQR
jgi:hypothetical protein